MADVIHVRFGAAYGVSAIGFAAALTIVFLVWHRVEGSPSIHSVDTPRRELFYWATVLATFALGTAVGDLTSYSFHLGFFSSAILFTAAIAVPALAYHFLGLNEVVAFWSAYILTRPLGASFADWMGVPPSLGGLNLGRGTVNLVLTALIAVFVGYLSITRVDAGHLTGAKPAC